MLTFFRKLRKGLLNSGATRKYLLYAIGEIALVVIGILIALQINNWNQFRLDRIQETAILHQLKSEFDANLIEADRKIYMRDFIIKASERLIELIDNSSLIVENRHIDSLIIYTRLNPTFNKRPGVTAELLNSGKLYLISNSEIRRLISEWAAIVEELNEEENLLTEIVSDRYTPFLTEHFTTRNSDNEFSKNFVERSWIALEGGQGLGRSKKDFDYNSLRGDPQFESLLSTINLMAQFGNTQTLPVKNHIVQLLKLIDDELKK